MLRAQAIEQSCCACTVFNFMLYSTFSLGFLHHDHHYEYEMARYETPVPFFRLCPVAPSMERTRCDRSLED